MYVILKKHSLFSVFPLSLAKYRQGSPITSDGKYLFIYSGGSIYKVGSGFGGTVKVSQLYLKLNWIYIVDLDMKMKGA